MIEKTNKILTAILGVIIIISIVYAVINLVIDLFKKPDILTKEELQLYMTSNNLIKDYTSYYYLEGCLNNIIEAVEKGKTDELYNIYMKDYKDELTKDEVYAKLKEFSVSTNQTKLKKAYVADNIYILVCDVDSKDETVLISLNSKNTNYEFAFAK